MFLMDIPPFIYLLPFHRSITVNDAERSPAYVKSAQIETRNTCFFEFSTTVEEGTLSMSEEQSPAGRGGG